jgi:sugar O-acyltransferase (sialic acid O-acetyltransferase NeuD family)
MRTVLLGAGSHAVSVIDLLESAGGYDIQGLLDNRLAAGENFHGYQVVGPFDSLSAHIASDTGVLVSVGQIGSPGIRAELYGRLVESGAKILTPVSPHAYASPRATLGAGTAVFHGAVVNANAIVGDNCIINSMALVEHDATIGHHTHVATGARINGGVSLGDRCFVGSGAIIFQGCRIPSDSIIPGGTIVKSWPLVD